MEGLIILGIVVLLPVLIVAGMYNSLVGKRNQVHNIIGTMDAMLKKRWDLVPNLAATVKGYADHERQLFEKVTQARARAQSGNLSDSEMVDLDNAFSQMVGVVRMTVENYPQLKASENFLHLQRTLNELEEQISAARRAYNASVTDYNNAVQMFPTNIIAGMFSFTTQPFFKTADPERQNPKISGLL